MLAMVSMKYLNMNKRDVSLLLVWLGFFIFVWVAPIPFFIKIAFAFIMVGVFINL